MANDWHLVHLGKFAQGGAGIVFTEAAAVQRRGRITHGDLGIWSDAHGQALAATTAFIRSMGSASAIQLAHAGRKASMQRPWHGNGPLNNDDRERGEEPWSVTAVTTSNPDTIEKLHSLTNGESRVSEARVLTEDNIGSWADNISESDEDPDLDADL